MSYFILLLAGCTSIVRFNSESHSPGEVKSSSNKSKNKSIVGGITQQEEFKEKYKGIQSIRIKIIKEAESWIGTPYKYGGTNAAGFDCSGFVKTVFDNCGITLPRTSQQQFTYTARISFNEIEPGDLIFFGKSGNISHVAIFGGNGIMIHASTSSGVIRQDLSDYVAYQTIQGYGRPAFN